jgi:hypothetical protein
MLPPYPTARTVAPALHEHFAKCSGSTEVPDIKTIEDIINVAFWASLRREEGRSPRISIAYIDEARAFDAFAFARPLPFEAGVVARLSPAVERPGIHLGVWRAGDALMMWGTTRQIPAATFILEVAEPGLLVVKRRREQDTGKYANVAVLQADNVKLIDETGIAAKWIDPANVRVQLATSMRAHGRGGSLLIVPHGSAEWRNSIVHPMTYEVDPPYRHLENAVDAVAGLTAVDGATVISDQYELLAFGVKLRRVRSSSPIEQVAVSEPVVGATTSIVNAAEIGGTRHLSAAQFVHDQRDALALVASQDGRFTTFKWSAPEGIVRAYSVETLLL